LESKDETKSGDRVLVDGLKPGELWTSAESQRQGCRRREALHYAEATRLTVRCFTRGLEALAAVHSVARLEESAFSRSHGKCECDCQDLKVIKVDTDENLLLVRDRFRAKRAIHFHPQGAQGQVTD